MWWGTKGYNPRSYEKRLTRVYHWVEEQKGIAKTTIMLYYVRQLYIKGRNEEGEKKIVDFDHRLAFLSSLLDLKTFLKPLQPALNVSLAEEDSSSGSNSTPCSVASLILETIVSKSLTLS